MHNPLPCSKFSNADFSIRHLWVMTTVLSPSPTWPNIFPIVHDRDKFSDREQSETNRNDENAMCNLFRLYEDSSRPFLNILPIPPERSKIAENK